MPTNFSAIGRPTERRAKAKPIRLYVGGPVVKDKLLFFGSYQGMRQLNGVGGGGTSSFFEPAFTDDRSRAALGRLFAGKQGASEAWRWRRRLQYQCAGARPVEPKTSERAICDSDTANDHAKPGICSPGILEFSSPRLSTKTVHR